MILCKGSFRTLLLYDVADEIDLDRLRSLLGAEPPSRSPGFRQPAPQYVRFERPPVVARCGQVQLNGGENAEVRLQYFDYGVVSVEFERPFEGGWDELIALSNRWINAPDIEQQALALARRHIEPLQPALHKPYPQWLDETYHVVHLREVRDDAGKALPASALVAQHGREIGQVIRGESLPLAEAEQREVLSSSMSYYPSDLLVVGWLAALIYDTPEGADPIIQLLEYANAQLLEYRRYDDTLTRLLSGAYDALERRGSFFSRWGLAREAAQLNRLRLEVIELTERTDNAIKFLSDMFYARAYRLAAAKVGANDYRNLVDQKLRTANELYQFMVSEFRDTRYFALEVMVVIILIIEIIPIFRAL